MKVSELIKLLEKLNPEAEIKYANLSDKTGSMEIDEISQMGKGDYMYYVIH